MTVEAAMAAMRTAEQEADFNARFDDTRNSRWARDRLRLIARDRATLERHVSEPDHRMLHQTPHCDGCGRFWPCPDARAAIDYWQEDA